MVGSSPTSKARTIHCACSWLSTETDGGSPAAAASSRQLLIRSPKEPRPDGSTVGCDGGASICGTTGTSIFGGGGGGSGGGLNCDAPGGRICADAVFTT